jgi:mannose-6-phosphate isomerase-like protein (cupin superfamily)
LDDASSGRRSSDLWPNEAREFSPGRRLIEVSEAPSEIAAYKNIKIIDVVYQPGAADPTEAVMDTGMLCYILAGEVTVKKTGKEPFTIKEGDFYTCGKGRSRTSAMGLESIGLRC